MNQADFDRTFKLPFNEATTWFRDKLNIPTAKWDELSAAGHAKGFASAGAYQADLLTELRQMTDKAIAGGMDIREFRKQFRPLVDKYGWQLQGGGPAWRSDLIFRTNIQCAYQAGRWQQFQTAGTEYLKYLHNDGVQHPRPNHLAMNGIVLPITDPFWSVNYPANGFGCKCRAVAANKAEYEATPAPLKTRPDNWRSLPDKGWAYNVGDTSRGYRALTEKFEHMPNDIARAWMQRWVKEPAFERFIAGEIADDFPVAVLRAEDMAALGAKRQTVWMSAETRDDHLAKHPEIGIDDYRLVPLIVDAGEVYRQGDVRLIFLKRSGKLYRAAIKMTEAGDDNYFLTLFTTSEEAAYRDVVSRRERLR